MVADASPHAPVPIWQRLSWIGVLIAGIGLYLLLLWTMVATQNVKFFPSLLLVGSATVPLTVLAFAWGGRRHFTAPMWIVVTSALLGGFFGTIASGVIENDTLHQLDVASILGIGVIEELSKLVVPLILALLFARRWPHAGVVVGIASGMGFAILETMGYGFQVLLQERSLAVVEVTLLLRALLAPAGHIAFTSLTVSAVWHVAAGERRPHNVAWVGGAFVIAVLLHALWDGTESLLVHLGVAVVSFVLLLILIHRLPKR